LSDGVSKVGEWEGGKEEGELLSVVNICNAQVYTTRDSFADGTKRGKKKQENSSALVGGRRSKKIFGFLF
jgi:hypothetical protein